MEFDLYRKHSPECWPPLNSVLDAKLGCLFRLLFFNWTPSRREQKQYTSKEDSNGPLQPKQLSYISVSFWSIVSNAMFSRSNAKKNLLRSRTPQCCCHVAAEPEEENVRAFKTKHVVGLTTSYSVCGGASSSAPTTYVPYLRCMSPARSRVGFISLPRLILRSDNAYGRRQPLSFVA